jgi:hypothetical protein
MLAGGTSSSTRAAPSSPGVQYSLPYSVLKKTEPFPKKLAYGLLANINSNQ